METRYSTAVSSTEYVTVIFSFAACEYVLPTIQQSNKFLFVLNGSDKYFTSGTVRFTDD